MDALLPAFVAALFSELGDKTQALALILSTRFPRRPLIAGLFVATLANGLIASAGGVTASGLVNHRAATLLLAVALLSAAVGGVTRAKAPAVTAYPRLGAFLATAFAAFVLEFGDKTQVLTFGVAAWSGSLLLPALGSMAGTMLVLIASVSVGPAAVGRLPILRLRRGSAALLGLSGLVMALTALALI